MSLTLYSHPLASFCQKVLIALYEAGTPFEAKLVDLGNPANRAAFQALWPMAKMPVLRDTARDRTVPETSIIIEYLSHHYPGPVRLLPGDPDAALEVRLLDRFFDLYVSEPMQKIVGDILRPANAMDPTDVDQARPTLDVAYGWLESRLGSAWAIGDGSTMADCSAAPALFYSGKVHPFEPAHPRIAAYYGRLMRRPAVARVFREAEPYMHLFPG